MDWSAVNVRPASSIDGVKASIAKQENGQYNKRNPDSGAMGKYQIMPFHLPSIGIQNNDAGIQQFLGSPKLQEQLFNKIVDDLNTKYKDPAKVAAAYYGGGGGAAKYGTAAGDVPQGKYPSINQYVKQVLGRVDTKQSFSQNKFQDNQAAARGWLGQIAQPFKEFKQETVASNAGIKTSSPMAMQGDTLLSATAETADIISGSPLRLVTGDTVAPGIMAQGRQFANDLYDPKTSAIGSDFALKNVAPVVGTILGVGLDPLNFIEGGPKAIAAATRGLEAAKTVDEASNVLRLFGMSEEIIANSAPKFVSLTDPKKIKEELTLLQALQNTASTDRRVVPENVVVQVVNKNGDQTFYRIPKGQLPEFKTTIDDGSQSFAGDWTKYGDSFHLTAKSPEQMTALGFKDGGIAKLDDIKAQLSEVPQSRVPKGVPNAGQWWKDQRGAIKNPFAKSPTPPEPSPPSKAAPEPGSFLDNNTKERSFITSVKETAPELETRVAGQYVPRSTDELSTAASNFIKDDINAAENLARTGTSDKAVATAAELIKKYTADARAATDEAVANALFDKAADVANVVARTLTEQGRAVQAASILGRLTPEGVVRFAAREIQKFNEATDLAKNSLGGLNPTAMRKKVPELTGEQVAEFTRQAKEIEQMPDGIEKAMAWNTLQDKISALVPSPLYKKIIAVWKAGLLTGIKTSGLNIASNLAHGVSEMVKDIPAAAVDSVAALFSGKRTLALTGKGTSGGIAEGFSKGWRYLRTGFDERDLGSKLDYSKVSFGTGKVAKAIQAYEETVFKILGSEDQPFYYGAKARSLFSQAIAEAKNQGLRGADRKTFVYDAVKNPTDDMLRYATYDAETAVFQNKTALGTAAKALQKIPGGELVVPFSKTPSSVAMQVVNYSPLGIVKTLAENIGKGRFNQRLFSQNLGRNLVGTGIMYLGYEMFNSGIISLGRPTKETEQKQWEAEGRSPNSILIDGKWRGANTLGPGGFTLILGGYLAQGIKDTGSVTAGLIQMAAALPKTLTDQTFLRGLDEFVGAITDPARNGKNYFSGLIGSLVPTLVSDVATATDTTARRTPGILDRLKSRIPGVRETLQPQITTFGKEKANDKNILEMMADPSRPTDAVTDDAVVTELRRLSDAGFQSTPTQVGDKEGYPDILTPEQNTELFRRSGELLKVKLDKLVQSPQYAKMDDEQKSKTIGQFADKVKVIARAEAAVTLTDGLTGEELKSELSRLKAGGLLTKQVFAKYVEIR